MQIGFTNIADFPQAKSNRYSKITNTIVKLKNILPNFKIAIYNIQQISGGMMYRVMIKIM